MMSAIVKLGSMILVLALLAGCNTVRGAGQDIESAGEGIQDASQDVEGSM